MALMNPRFLVTAGSTRERIDDVRDWGNIFTGNTGFDIARALAAVGAVHLLTSNASHRTAVEAGLGLGHTVTASSFACHADLRQALEVLMTSETFDAVFMTAAVSDYRPAGAFQIVTRATAENGDELWRVRSVQQGKVKSSFDQIAIAGARTEKLVDLFRSRWGYKGLLFKFKLEVGLAREQLVEVGRASRDASGADYLVANTLEMVSGSEPGALLLDGESVTWIPRGALASKLARVVADRLSQGRAAR